MAYLILIPSADQNVRQKFWILYLIVLYWCGHIDQFARKPETPSEISEVASWMLSM